MRHLGIVPVRLTVASAALLLPWGEQGGERIEPRILSDVGYGERQRPPGWLVLDADERAAVPLDGERV